MNRPVIEFIKLTLQMVGMTVLFFIALHMTGCQIVE